MEEKEKKGKRMFFVWLVRIRSEDERGAGTENTENTELAIKNRPRLVRNKIVNRGCYILKNPDDSEVK